MTAGGVSSRQRYKAQVTEEIKQRAWEQIGTAGVSALSLNAIAKHVGMSGPGLYRYFASRDDLITELIKDAYRSLVDALRTAFDAGAGVAELASTVREWAVDDPQRYFLIYGTPVPGYHAPEDTTEISSELMSVLIAAFSTQSQTGPMTPFDAHLDSHRGWADNESVPAATLHRALTFWTRLHGLLSLELAGHFNGMEFDPALLFADEVNTFV